MKQSFLKFFFVLMLVATPALTFAQEGFDDDVDDEETPQTFIDGFIGVGIAAGAAYGFSRLRDKK